MIAFPNAKINIGLYVTEKCSDGFHNLESVFYPIPICDILEVVLAKETTFTYSGLTIPQSTSPNLIERAYLMLKEDFDLPNISAHLHKKIPMGAGLGGGSSNATEMVKLLNQVFELKLPQNEIKYYTSKLGSDCSFFVYNEPLFCTDRGTNFETTKVSLKGYHIVILMPPNVHISTKEAFSGINPSFPSKNLAETIQLPISEWKENISNDFEKTIFPLHPSISTLKQKMYDNGALYASMSGSGAAVFGLFENEPTPFWENEEFVVSRKLEKV